MAYTTGSMTPLSIPSEVAPRTYFAETPLQAVIFHSMLNISARIFLVLSAFVPPLVVFAANVAFRRESLALWTTLLIIACFVTIGALIILKVLISQGESYELQVHSVDSRNYESLTFMLAYILPFVRQDFATNTASLVTTASVFFLILIVMVHSDAYHFNPLLRLFGYRFYSVKATGNTVILLITRERLRLPDQKIQTAEVAPGFYIQKGTDDA